MEWKECNTTPGRAPSSVYDAEAVPVVLSFLERREPREGSPNGHGAGRLNVESMGARNAARRCKTTRNVFAPKLTFVSIGTATGATLQVVPAHFRLDLGPPVRTALQVLGCRLAARGKQTHRRRRIAGGRHVVSNRGRREREDDGRGAGDREASKGVARLGVTDESCGGRRGRGGPRGEVAVVSSDGDDV